MKVRASNLLIGTAALTAITIALSGFLGYRKFHAVAQRSPLRIVFEGSASGLAKGGSVNFDGVHVGEVTSIGLDGPRKVVALVTLENSAPIRKDTVVGLEAQGLTGLMAIALTGGDAAAPPVPLDADGIPTLTADLSEAQSIRDTLHNVDRVLIDNRDVMNDAVRSFETYTRDARGQRRRDRRRAAQGGHRAGRLRPHHRRDRRTHSRPRRRQGRRALQKS